MLKEEIYPPIENRTTKQLLEIIETKEQWRDEVVRQTQQELIKRGVSLKAQDLRAKSKVKFLDRIKSIKSRATYTTTEKILIVFLGPIIALIFQDFFMFQAGEGYKKKNRQGILYLMLGISLWVLFFYFLHEYVFSSSGS